VRRGIDVLFPEIQLWGPFFVAVVVAVMPSEVEASRLESVSFCRSPTPLCVLRVLCVEGRSLLSFVIDHWAFDIDYCFFAVPPGLYYRHPSSGAGAGMNRLTNLAASFIPARRADRQKRDVQNRYPFPGNQA